MAIGYELSDDVLAALAPMVAFWIFSGISELLVYLFPNSRLHTKEEVDVKNKASRWTVAKGALLNQAIQIMFILLVFKIIGNDIGTPKPQPSLLKAASQFFVAMVIYDSWQYFGHRYMHANKFLFKHIHSTHHDLIVPYSFGSLYANPLDGFVMDTVGGVFAAVLSGMTPPTSMYFFSFATIRGVDLHCGLWFSWNPFRLLFSDSAFHDVHHQLRGHQHNFAQIFFVAWDKILGTYAPYSVEKKKGGGYEVRPIKKK